MIAEERRRKLLQLVQGKEFLSIAAIRAALQVSRMTVHRDLEHLAATGLLQKVRGGVAAVKPQSADTVLQFSERRFANAAAKEAIAQHLLKIVAGAARLALDDSTTVFALSQVLPANAQQLILTNGLPLFQELQRRNLGARLALTGGEPYAKGGALIGPMALKTLEGMRFDVAVVSAVGWMQEQGQVYDARPEMVAFKQALLARSDQAILALDRNKINFLGPYPLCRLDEFDLLVTEDGPQKTKKRARAT